MKTPNAQARPPDFNLQTLDFHFTPFTVIWETTQACDLKCVHCRAEAQPRRHPLELSTEEGLYLLEQIRDLGSPVFIITGGDPLKREDLFDLIAYGTKIGLSVAVTPSGTPLLTSVNFAKVAEGFGCYGERVTRLEDLAPAFARARAAKRPAVLDIPVRFTPHPMDRLWMEVVFANVEIPLLQRTKKAA